MEDARFDRIARLLGRGVDRRAGFGAALAGLAAALGRGTGAAAGPAEEQCLRNGQRCGKKSGNNGGPCKNCCSRYWTTGTKRSRCTCKPDGMTCNNSSQCCNGTCTAGLCAPACATGGSCTTDADCCPDESCAEGTCVADTPTGEFGVTGAILGLIPPVAAPGYRLQMTELVWEPGAYATSHFHPLAQIACVQSGALGMSIQAGATTVLRGGAGSTPESAEPLPVGAEVVLKPRDCVAYDEFAAHTVHAVWNASRGRTVLWTADLVALGEPYTTYVDENGDPIP